MRQLHPITIGGVTYRSTRAVAAAFGVDHATLQARLKRGIPVSDALGPPTPRGLRRGPVHVLDSQYASQKAACNALKLNYNTVKARMARYGCSFEQSVLWTAPQVESVHDKCVSHGVLRWTYWGRKRRGWSENQALGIDPPPVSEPRPRSAANMMFQYGMTIDQFELLIAQRGGLCWICGRDPKPPCVDHCHKTGAVRGILCRPCNTAIGQMGDDPDRLRAAAAYLETKP